MEKAKILEKLIKENGYSLKAFAKKCDIPYTTLYTILKNGVGRASVNTVMTICKELGITVEQLEEMAQGTSSKAYEPTYDDLQKLIARNGKALSNEQKMELIKLLSQLD
jgi:transcriptional regulator with XRE-family HTH domain